MQTAERLTAIRALVRECLDRHADVVDAVEAAYVRATFERNADLDELTMLDARRTILRVALEMARPAAPAERTVQRPAICDRCKGAVRPEAWGFAECALISTFVQFGSGTLRLCGRCAIEAQDALTGTDNGSEVARNRTLRACLRRLVYRLDMRSIEARGLGDDVAASAYAAASSMLLDAFEKGTVDDG